MFSWIPREQSGVEILTCGAPQWAVPLPAGQVDDRAALVGGLQGSRGERKAFEVFLGDDLLDEWEEPALLEANVLFEQLSEPIENFRLDASSLDRTPELPHERTNGRMLHCDLRQEGGSAVTAVSE